MDKTQGIIITHALNDNETLISGLTGVWQHPLNVKFSFLSFLALLSNKRNINAHCLYVYLLLCVCYFLLNRRKCVVRGQFQNSTTEIQSKLKSWKTKTHTSTPTLPLSFLQNMFLIIPGYLLCAKSFLQKRTKEHENVVTDTERNQNEGIERFKSENSFISVSHTHYTSR